MNHIVFSILLVLIGLFVGIIFMMILNSLKVLSATKKADKLLEDAEIQADKLKRDSILEAKEERLNGECTINISEARKVLVNRRNILRIDNNQ